jgi:predicted PurR-regulated permease PerM
MKETLKLPLILRITVVLLFLWLSYFILTEFRNYLYPITLGGLFAYLLYPVASYLEKRKMPRIFANILSIILGIAVVSAVFFFIYKQMGLFLEDLPSLKIVASRNVNTIFKHLTHLTGVETPQLKEQFKLFAGNLLNISGQNFKSTFGATFQTVFAVAIMPVYIFFLLFYRNKFHDFILMVVPDHKHAIASKIIDEVNQVVVNYMTGVFVVVTILVILNSTGFVIIGMKHALLLGILAAIMNFIPYYGTIIGYMFPLFIAVFTMNSPQYAFLVVIQFVIVQFTENNILTPNIVGAHVSINPFMIILAITFGGFIWGLPGMFIAVPVAAVFRVLGENLPELAPIGYLLGSEGTEEHSISRKKLAGFIFKKHKNIK